MNRLIYLVLFTICFKNLNAQGHKELELLTNDKEWFEGTILLTDGKELKGLVKYNDRNGVLAYHDGENSKPFSPRSVSGFEFFDESIQKQRIFYTLEYEDPDKGMNRLFFFEVIRDHKTFAFLIKADPVEAKQKVRNDFGSSATYSTKLELSQTETSYIMDDKGDIQPYFKITNREDGTKSIFTGKDTKTEMK